MEMTLNCLCVGQKARILALNMDGPLRRRLLDFGMIEGTTICCLRRSPAGSPVLYCVRGTQLALRTQDSRLISVEMET